MKVICGAADGGVANWENYNSVLVVIFFNVSLMVIANSFGDCPHRRKVIENGGR